MLVNNFDYPESVFRLPPTIPPVIAIVPNCVAILKRVGPSPLVILLRAKKMVVRLKSGETIRGALRYNEDKVMKEVAELILANDTDIQDAVDVIPFMRRGITSYYQYASSMPGKMYTPCRMLTADNGSLEISLWK